MSLQAVESVLGHRRKCGEILAERFRDVDSRYLDAVSLALSRVTLEIDILQRIVDDPAWLEEDSRKHGFLTEEAAQIEKKAEKEDEKLMKKLNDPNLFYERWV